MGRKSGVDGWNHRCTNSGRSCNNELKILGPYFFKTKISGGDTIDSTQEQIGFIFKQSKKYVNTHNLNKIFQFFEKPMQILKLSFISQRCN